MSEDNAPSLAELTTRIVTAYFRSHDLAAADVGRLVTTVSTELGALGRPPEEPDIAVPAVPIEDSVRRDSLVCLVCGKRFKTLRRHLLSAHELTPGDYREQYGLDRDYPMVAPASSAQRAEIARQSGLGLRGAPEPETPPEPEAEEPQAAEPVAAPALEQPKRRLGIKPIRGRRAAKPSSAADPARQPQPDPEPLPQPED